MNPWQSLRREINGAMRSIRYDLSVNQARRTKTRDTVPLPVGARRPASDRRRFYAVATAVLLPVAGVSGYFAVTSGFGTLFPGDGAPNGLPATSHDQNSPAPSPDAQPAVVNDPQRGRPAPRTSPIPLFTTPVPTPAPTCHCTPPPPTPAPTQSASPSPTPSPERSGSPSPSISTPPSRSRSHRPTLGSMP